MPRAAAPLSASPPALRLLHGVGLALVILVLAAVSARWAGSGRLRPPSGRLPLLLGVTTLLLGGARPRLRLPAWGVAWAALLWVAADLVRIQVGLDRPLPALYLGLFVGLLLLGPACAWRVALDRRPSGEATPIR